MSVIHLKSTSWGHILPNEPIPLSEERQNDKGQTFRRSAIPVLDEHGQLRELKILIERKRKNDTWENIGNFKANTMKAGDVHNLTLEREHCQNLIRALDRLADVSGVDLADERAKRGVVLGDKQSLQTLEAIRDKDPALLAQFLGDNEALLDAHLISKRREGLREFEQHMANPDFIETEWKDFFKRNKWVFGLCLDLRFLDEVAMEAPVAGAGLSGTGTAEADGMLATQSENAKYMVVLEIKAATTVLLTPYKGRVKAGAWMASTELSGGIAQLQNYCYRWEREGQDFDLNRTATEGIETIWPRGILVIGRTSDFGKDPMQKKAFQRFRESLHTPTIITFDELLEKARHIVGISAIS